MTVSDNASPVGGDRFSLDEGANVSKPIWHARWHLLRSSPAEVAADHFANNGSVRNRVRFATMSLRRSGARIVGLGTVLCASGIVTLAMSAGCRGTSPQESKVDRAALGGDLVARVGAVPLNLAGIASAMTDSDLSRDEALAKLLDTHVVGYWAMRGGLEGSRRNTVQRSLLARAILAQVENQTRVPTTASEVELNEETQLRWFELDRPVAFRLAHFVVKTEKANESQARDLAQRIALAVKGITEAKQFVEKARSIPSGGLSVVAEQLTPVTADGRTFQTDPTGKPVSDAGKFDQDFARAAFRLERQGDQSQLIRTRFGFHVLLLVERVDGYTMPIEQRTSLLLPDIMRRRGLKQVDRILAERRGAVNVVVDRAALEWTSRIQVAQ